MFETQNSVYCSKKGAECASSHVHNILVKIGAANRTEAAVYAVRHSLTAPPSEV